MIAPYAGITTTLSAAVSDATSETISITNLPDLDINIGDYLTVDGELVRVKTTVAPTDNSLTVFRGVLGTKRSTHDSGSVVNLVTTLLHSQISMIEQLVLPKNCYHSLQRETVVSTSTPE